MGIRLIGKPDWWERCENPIIRQYILDLCKSYVPNSKRRQEELYHEGWVWIERCRPGKTAEYYMHIGFVGVTRHFHIYIRPISHTFVLAKPTIFSYSLKRNYSNRSECLFDIIISA